MTAITPPRRLLIVDIDGLRQDVFHQALTANQIPNLARLLGGGEEKTGPIHLDPLSTAPSITFCAQSSIFTGQHPDRHGIPGNQFFDRFGKNQNARLGLLAGIRPSNGPRFYAFDVGDMLAYDDAVLTFTGPVGLLGESLSDQTPTLYERAAARGLSSTVVFHMVSRGASTWIRPNLIDIARFTKGGGLFGLSAKAYDHEMIDQTLAHLRAGHRPDLLTVYFMGLDHTSHHDGPGAQLDYLSRVVDVEVGRLTAELERLDLLSETLVLVVSDHGQIEVIPDDRHSLRLSFPFDREMAYLFDSLGLDVYDVPGEGPNCDAVVASNGGLAHVYLRHHYEDWSSLPRFEDDVLRVGRAFWEAHTSGLHAPDLHNALSMVLVRNTEQQGWDADYQALTPDNRLVSIQAFLDEHPEVRTVDAAARLRHLAGPFSGDVLLAANYAEGFYFGGPTVGVHGGLHPEDSLSVASFGWLDASPAQMETLREMAAQTVQNRLAAEGGTYPLITDLVPIITRLFDL